MEVFQKINAPYKRYTEGPSKGRLIIGDWSLPEFQYLANNDWEWTEKVDGTNIRISWNAYEGEVEFGGRSNNAVIPVPLLEYLNNTFNKALFAAFFENSELEDITLFGEGYGPKIQGGGKYRDDHSFVLFDIKIGSWWLQRDDVNDIADKLDIRSVPIVGNGTLYEAIEVVKNGLKSKWGPFEAEGLVCRPTVQLFDRRGERIITKVKSRDFK